MLQVASEIVNNPEDKTQVSLIFANQTEDDIILRDELDQMAAKHDNFQVHACPALLSRSKRLSRVLHCWHACAR